MKRLVLTDFHKMSFICLSVLLVAAAGCGVNRPAESASSGADSPESGSSQEAPRSASESVPGKSPSTIGATETNTETGIGKWVQKSSMGTPRFDFSSEVVNGKIYVLGGFTADNYHTTASAEGYDPKSNQWEKSGSLSSPRTAMQTVVLGGKIYAIGGIVNSKTAPNGVTDTADAERYDPASGKCAMLKSMHTDRQYHRLASVGGKIYAIGGSAGSSVLSSVEEYDPASNTWAEKTPMSVPRMHFGMGIVDGKIYVIGGFSATDTLATMERYDPKTNRWTKREAMPAARDGFKTETVDEKIYVMGGWKPGSNGGSITGVLTSVEEYDPAIDKWTEKAPMKQKKGEFCTAVLNGKIYAVGGYNDIKYTENPAANFLSSVQEYNPQTDTWTEKSPLKIGRRNFETVILNNSLYVIGGTIGPYAENKGTASVEEYTAVQ